MKVLKRFSFFLVSLLFSGLVFAEKKVGLTAFIDHISGPTDLLIHVLLAACLVLGVVLIITAMGQFNAHRMNPKFVPLVNPMFYLLLGFLSLSVPFLDYFFQDQKTANPIVGPPKLKMQKKTPRNTRSLKNSSGN